MLQMWSDECFFFIAVKWDDISIAHFPIHRWGDVVVLFFPSRYCSYEAGAHLMIFQKALAFTFSETSAPLR